RALRTRLLDVAAIVAHAGSATALRTTAFVALPALSKRPIARPCRLLRPLSPAALAIIDKLPRIGRRGLVFTSNGRAPIGNLSAWKRLLDEASGVTGWVLHDLRRTARSLMGRARVLSDHAEMCLGHVLPGVRGVYDRHEYHAEKKAAYEALAGLIERIVNPQ